MDGKEVSIHVRWRDSSSPPSAPAPAPALAPATLQQVPPLPSPPAWIHWISETWILFLLTACPPAHSTCVPSNPTIAFPVSPYLRVLIQHVELVALFLIRRFLARQVHRAFNAVLGHKHNQAVGLDLQPGSNRGERKWQQVRFKISSGFLGLQAHQ